MWFHRVVGVVVYAAWALAGLSVVMLFVNSPSSGGPTADGPSTTLPAELVEAGAPIYEQRCATCHGGEGGGGLGPALAGRMVAAYPAPADQATVIREGRNGMPDFADRLTDDEIDAVVAYTRSLQ